MGADRRSSLREDKYIRYEFIPQLHHNLDKKKLREWETFAHPNYPKMLESVTDSCLMLPRLVPGLDLIDRDPYSITLISLGIRPLRVCI